MSISVHFLVFLGDFHQQTDLILVCNEGSLVGLYMQDYKHLCAEVMICGIPVDNSFDFYILTPMLCQR